MMWTAPILGSGRYAQFCKELLGFRQAGPNQRIIERFREKAEWVRKCPLYNSYCVGFNYLEGVIYHISTTREDSMTLFSDNAVLSDLWMSLYTGAQFQEQPESEDYQGSWFYDVHAPLSILFRKGKSTPTRSGFFLTLWKRPEPYADIMPFGIEDGFEFVVVVVKSPTGLGQFVFSADVLEGRDIFSRLRQGGKRAFRVYPPWVDVVTAQGKTTQKWQSRYYMEIAGPLQSQQTRLMELLSML
jgi:hypothetical protein